MQSILSQIKKKIETYNFTKLENLHFAISLHQTGSSKLCKKNTCCKCFSWGANCLLARVTVSTKSLSCMVAIVDAGIRNGGCFRKHLVQRTVR